MKKNLQLEIEKEKKELKAFEEERKLKDELKEIKAKKFEAKHGSKLKTLKRVGKNIKEDFKSAGKTLTKAGKQFSEFYYKPKEDIPKSKSKGIMETSEDWSFLKKEG